MKIPPFLLGAALIFWGWHTKLFIFAAIMAVALEGSRLVKLRWDLSLSDFKRVSDLSSIILIGMLTYLFVSQSLIDLIFILLQWTPLMFFPLLLCQCYSTSGLVDARALFLTLRRKWREPHTKPPIMLDLTYPYFFLCLLSAGTANVRTRWFYLGFLLLPICVLWFIRSKRYSPVLWIGFVCVAVIGGYVGQIKLYQLQRSLEQNKTLARWFTGIEPQDADPYETTTAIGDIGTVKLTNRVIFRVKSNSGDHPPLLLREASYNAYQFSQWYAVQSEFTGIQPEADGITWKLQPDSEASRSITVSSYLKDGEGILKLPTGTFQIENPPGVILTSNQFGTLKVKEGPDLITYQILFSSQGAVDSPPNERDVFVPPDEMPVIKKFAEELRISSTSPDEILQKISAFFQENFSYSLKLRRYVQDTTPLADFLFNSRTGHCEYFATATVLLLRTIGIPTRYVVGYAVDALDKEGKWTIVRGRDAHAWTLVYINGAWHDFDTTPSSWRQLEDEAASPLEWISDFWAWCMFTISEWQWRERVVISIRYLGWLLIPLFLMLGWRFYSKRRIKHVIKRKETKPERTLTPGADSGFYAIEKRLGELGFARYPWEPLLHWMTRIEKSASALSTQSLHRILTLHYRYRFDPEGLSLAEKTALRSSVQSWLEQHEPEFPR